MKAQAKRMQESQKNIMSHASSSSSPGIIRRGKNISNGMNEQKSSSNCFDDCKFETIRMKCPAPPAPNRCRTSTGGKDLKASRRDFQPRTHGARNQKSTKDALVDDTQNNNNHHRMGLRRSSRINSSGSSGDNHGTHANGTDDRESWMPQKLTTASDEDEETSNSSQGCLKLTIRVRRLESKLRRVSNPVLETTDDKEKCSLRSKDPAITYEVLPSSASDCSSFSPMKNNSSLRTSPRRNKKKKKVKKRKRKDSSSGSSQSLEDDAVPLTRSRGTSGSTLPSGVGTSGISSRGTASAHHSNSPFIGAKRLRLIVGNDSISIDIPPNSSQDR